MRIVRSRLQAVLPLVLLAAFVLLYGLTLQTDINGHSIPALIDVGELQIALSTWGTTHSPGYPLYTILGNLLSELARLVGIAPAAATSALSYIASLAAFAMLYAFVWKATRQAAATLTAVILLGLAPTYWLNSVVTEVYGLNAFLVTIALYSAWRMQQGGRLSPIVMAAMLGLTISHHAITAVMLPAFLILLWEPGRKWLSHLRSPKGPGLHRSLVGAILAFCAPFALYVYLPLRYLQQAPWVYENWRFGLAEPVKLTLDGFLAFETGREYSTNLSVPQSLPQLGARLMDLAGLWSRELGAVGLAAALMGMALVLLGKQRTLGLALWLTIFGYAAFSSFYKDLLDTSLSLVSATFIPLVIGAGLFVAWAQGVVARIVPRYPATPHVAAWVLAAIVLIGPLSHVPGRYSDIHRATKDPSGREVIKAAQRIPDACPTVLSLWGIDYFAYHYAKLSTRELPCLRILPLHGDIRQSWQRGERVFVVSHFFYQLPVEELEKRVGRLYLRSAGYSNVELADRPARAPDQEIIGPPTDMGGMITLLGYRLQRSQDGRTLYLTLYWQANNAQRPDYSVFVHVSDKPAISGPTDIVSQADSLHPVYGWYPSSRWSAGEVVRDDYAISEQPGRPARLISVGLYQSVGGSFVNLGSRNIVVADR